MARKGAEPRDWLIMIIAVLLAWAIVYGLMELGYSIKDELGDSQTQEAQ